MKISSNFHNSGKGIIKAPLKRKIFSAANKIRKEKSSDSFHNARVINAQELMSGGNHINAVRFTFSAFSIEKLINRLISRLLLKIDNDDLKQSFAKFRRAAFGNAP